MALDKGQYTATVQLNFKNAAGTVSKQTGFVEFEIK